MSLLAASHPMIDALAAQESVGVAVVDAEHRYVRVNASLARMNGLPADEHLGRTITEVLGETGAPLSALVDEVLAGRPLVDIERTEADAGGVLRTFRFSYLPIVGEGGVAGVLALVVDATEHLQVRAELASARHRLYLALEGTNTGTFEFDLVTQEVRWSENMGPLYGRPRGWSPTGYESYRDTIHPDHRADLAERVRRAAEVGHDYEQEFQVLYPDGTAHWRHSRVHVLRGEDGRPALLVGFVHDADARKHRERRAEFLARAGLALAESLDPAATLQHVADLAVGELGDWCSVTVAEPHGPTRLVAAAHRDPGRAGLAHELHRRFPQPADAANGTTAVIRTGLPEYHPEVTDAVVQAVARGPEHLELLRALDLQSMMIVPMLAGGRTLGAIAFGAERGGRRFDAEDLALAEELGRRAGLALDNARLFEQVRSTAMTLQRSLLPAGLPDLPGYEIAARYHPGEAGAAVGGDWYDVFPLPNGSVALVVGDVMGRGIPAAAGMGRVRSALQAHLYDTWDPVAALERLDDLVMALRIVPFATALVAVLEPGDGILHCCSSGHPPPLIRGDHARLLHVAPGPPIGARMTPRRGMEASLAPGETLMLYTDGLVEAREAPLDERLELLCSVSGRGPHEAGLLLDHAVRSMVGPTAPDDVAVIGIRRDPA